MGHHGFAVSGFWILVSSLAAGAFVGEVQGQSTAYQAVAVTDGALLRGKVVFAGEVPEPKKLLITKDQEVCGEGYRERHEVVVADGGGLRNVVVFIEGIKQGKAWPDAADGYVLDQRDCSFSPHIQVVPRGAELNIVNGDPVLHNIHGYELIGRRRRTLFNLGQPPEKGTIIQLLRPRRSKQVRLECDAHDFMQGWIYAADNPYAVAVNPDGSFAVEDVPSGTYTVKAWHPYLGMQEQEVTLSPGGAGEVGFECPAQ